ncbi:MAG: hypothetical protein ISS26_07330 [Candidatus Omnitrophica bacterium]|nr:hypothetical protein [Candidatus Omnitrophota bacterium]
MIKNISKREKWFGAATLGIALAALAYNMIMEPLTGMWKSLDDSIRQREILLTKHSRILRNGEKISKLDKEYSKYFQETMLRPEEESAMALGQIERLARGANVHITNIKPMGIRRHENFNRFTYKVTSESRSEELAKFIYELQSSEQLMKVERMVLRAKEKEADIIKAILHITKISISK